MKRSVLSVILFSVITCGIYAIYWFVVTTNDIERNLQNKENSLPSGGMCLLLGIVTCGIYMYYWFYIQGKRIGALREQVGLSSSDNSLIYLVLAIFGLSIVNYGIMQNELNQCYDVIDPTQSQYNQN